MRVSVSVKDFRPTNTGWVSAGAAVSVSGLAAYRNVRSADVMSTSVMDLSPSLLI